MSDLLTTDFRAAIALGSNLGDSLSHLRKAAKALCRLSSSPTSVRGSSIYRTTPVDCPLNSPFFLNAVVEIDWKDSAEALWKELKRLEMAAGRQYPSPSYHAPRTLDLDLLYLGSLCTPTDSNSLVHLPHPRLCSRRFVLAPLADCAPNRVLPNEKMTVRQLLAALPPFPSAEKIDELLLHKKHNY